MPVGFSQGLSFDRKRANWSRTGHRPLAWCAWYPANDDAVEIAPSPSWFKQKPVAPNAPMKKSTDPRSLVLLSHGSGGLVAWNGSDIVWRRPALWPWASIITATQVQNLTEPRDFSVSGSGRPI